MECNYVMTIFSSFGLEVDTVGGEMLGGWVLRGFGKFQGFAETRSMMKLFFL